MKTEELKEKGLTDEQISFVMAENGKAISKLQDENKRLKEDCDVYKKRAESAEETLKGFDGKDFDAIQCEASEWKKKAEDAEADFKKQIYERDFEDALSKEISEYKFTSESAKKSIMADIKSAGLKLKDGKILGLSDLIAQFKESDASAFVDDAKEQAEQSKAKFTQGMGSNAGKGSTLTKEDIMKISDATERQNAIKENIDLFQ